jgi:DNA-binding protein YbaB
MFDKAKTIMKFIKAKSDMEKKLEPIWATVERGNYKVVVNANKKVVSIEESGQENKVLRDLVNDAMKEAQKKAEKKMKASGEDFGLGDML